MIKINSNNILFQDNSLLVINKPHGLHVIQDRYLAEKDILIDILRSSFNEKILLVHRLDAGTGGVIIFAKNIETQRFLSKQFEASSIKKEYLAIVEGSVENQILSLPIAKANHGRYKVNFTSGKEAITEFETLSSNGKHSLILAKPRTGRTHQIRIHLKILKAPLIHDFQYNNNSDSRLFSLFARRISFIHPLTNQIVVFTAPISEFMKKDIISLELGNEAVVSLLDESNS